MTKEIYEDEQLDQYEELKLNWIATDAAIRVLNGKSHENALAEAKLAFDYQQESLSDPHCIIETLEESQEATLLDSRKNHQISAIAKEFLDII